MFDYIKADKNVLVDKDCRWANDGVSWDKVGQLIAPLLKFYVVETPSPGLSARSIPLIDYGWTQPWKKAQQLNKKIKGASTNPDLYYSAAKLNKMQEVLEKAKLLDYPEPRDDPFEAAAFFDCKKNQTLSLFYHLRNGFAHGRFCIFEFKREYWFAIEDVTSPGKGNPTDNRRVSARIVLKYSTLRKWIKLIQDGPHD